MFDLKEHLVMLYCSFDWEIEFEKVDVFETIINMFFAQNGPEFVITDRYGLGPKQNSDWECGYFMICTIEKMIKKERLHKVDYKVKALVRQVREQLEPIVQ